MFNICFLKGRGALLTAFANVCGVQSPTMINFKLPACHPLSHKTPDNLTVGSYEPV